MAKQRRLLLGKLDKKNYHNSTTSYRISPSRAWKNKVHDRASNSRPSYRKARILPLHHEFFNTIAVSFHCQAIVLRFEIHIFGLPTQVQSPHFVFERPGVNIIMTRRCFHQSVIVVAWFNSNEHNCIDCDDRVQGIGQRSWVRSPVIPTIFFRCLKWCTRMSITNY